MEQYRRYVIIRISASDVIQRVKVITGDMLAKLDTTGTLTQKYQASLVCGTERAELITPEDTGLLSNIINRKERVELAGLNPTDDPSPEILLPISDVFARLAQMIGVSFEDRGYDQERRRGADLHAQVCKHLGYSSYLDDGRFPDVRQQLLEVKLQTSPTIDLGLVCPDSKDPLDMRQIVNCQVRHCDVRYALFYAVTNGVTVTLTHFFLTTGEGFFTRFPQFGGRVLNKKLQIPLPADFFD